ncbi:uncharacterized protein LOC126910408 [Daktulosphaira vitifoliae]|uniref:uncharacterized protein LOC126910408 n=1 Tax=Daktulosphaira vitifoliae TaxID=58002 RepID=UPI0021A9FB59|nr:uncharacterized protein LOC126910408 [Daktulosphaira vitifoliae]
MWLFHKKCLHEPKTTIRIISKNEDFFFGLSLYLSGEEDHGKYLKEKLGFTSRDADEFNYQEIAKKLKISIYVYMKKDWYFYSKIELGNDPDENEKCLYFYFDDSVGKYEIVTDVFTCQPKVKDYITFD